MNGITRDRTNHCETPSTVPSMIPAAAEAATAPGLSAVAAPTIAGPMNPADSPAVTTTTHLIHTPPQCHQRLSSRGGTTQSGVATWPSRSNATEPKRGPSIADAGCRPRTSSDEDGA